MRPASRSRRSRCESAASAASPSKVGRQTHVARCLGRARIERDLGTRPHTPELAQERPDYRLVPAGERSRAPSPARLCSRSLRQVRPVLRRTCARRPLRERGATKQCSRRLWRSPPGREGRMNRSRSHLRTSANVSMPACSSTRYARTATDTGLDPISVAASAQRSISVGVAVDIDAELDREAAAERTDDMTCPADLPEPGRGSSSPDVAPEVGPERYSSTPPLASESATSLRFVQRFRERGSPHLDCGSLRIERRRGEGAGTSLAVLPQGTRCSSRCRAAGARRIVGRTERSSREFDRHSRSRPMRPTR